MILSRLIHLNQTIENLQDSIAGNVEGNRESLSCWMNKVVYEEILNEARLSAEDENKRVVIVKVGWDGERAIVAVNLLAELTRGSVLSICIQNSAHVMYIEKNKKAV